MAILASVILRGTRAGQPAATAVSTGALYFVTDEGVTERSSGTAWQTYSGGGTGTVTTSGSPASGNLAKFSGAAVVTNADLSGDVTTSGTAATSIAANAVTTAKILDANVTTAKIADANVITAKLADDGVTYAKMQNVSAASKLLGRGSASSAGDPQEITLGANLSMSGTTLAAGGKYTVGITVDGAGTALTTGVKGYRSIPVSGTIVSARVLADQSGSIVFDIWKDTYANYPPTVADTITASAKPTISSATKAEDTTLTGWTTSVTAGDVLGFNVDSVTTITRAILELIIQV